MDTQSGATEVPLILSPIDACDDMWRMGIIGQDEVPVDPNAADFPIPDLVGCRQGNGVGAAFPRESLSHDDAAACRSLGMTVWNE